MKRCLITAAVLSVGICSYAHAQQVFHTWQGDLFVTAPATAQCAAVGMRSGSFARAVYRPRSLGNNGNADFLNFYFPASGVGVQVTASANAGRLNGATAATVRYLYGSGGNSQMAGVVISGATTTPALPATTDDTVEVTFTIEDIFSSPNRPPSDCNVILSGILAKKP